MGSTTDTLTPTQLAAELFRAIKGRNCVAWVGAGLSRPVYDDWPSAVSKLCEACGVKHLADSTSGTNSEILISKAEECRQANQGKYEETLAELYGRNEVRSRRAYNWLVKAPFKAYVTTNFDPLLSEAGDTAFEHNSLFSYPLLEPADLERNCRPIFYIHGHARPNGLPSGKNLVLARSEFDQAYQGIVGLFVQNLLLTYPIVFIGCRLSDPDIYEQMRRVHSMHMQIETKHPGYVRRARLALLPAIFRKNTGTGPTSDRERDTSTESQETLRFKEFHTDVLRYDPADPEQHSEIEDMLKHLCSLCSEAPKVSLGEAGPK